MMEYALRFGARLHFQAEGEDEEKSISTDFKFLFGPKKPYVDIFIDFDEMGIIGRAFSPESILMDVDLREINSSQKEEAFIKFFQGLTNALGKECGVSENANYPPFLKFLPGGDNPIYEPSCKIKP